MFRRAASCVLLVLVAACARQPDARMVSHVDAAQATPAATVAAPALPPRARFASLPDRGELLAYPDRVVERDGAYTRYRARISEQHALHAIAQGHLRVTTPSGEVLDFQYDRHVEHPSGDWTWIGHIAGQQAEQAILTFGRNAAYGSIAQPGRLPLRLDAHDAASWLIDTDPVKVAGIRNSATRPRKPDYLLLDQSLLRGYRGPHAAASAPMTATATALPAKPTVDVVIGYTAGFAADHGGDSGAVTRLHYLVDVANAAYQNSQLSAQARLVKALPVNYTETNSNDTALEQLSGYRSGVGPVTPNAAFNALRAARETYGADLVSLVRKFRDPEQDGCGLAWLLGGGKQGIRPGAGWDDLAYSVVGDGRDAGTDGKTYYCLDETLAHEMGHNEGSAHDRDTAAGDDGVLDDPDDYGAYPYSFGYKTANGNFYTVMAYGDAGQHIYRVFSNPRITYCGGRACGVANVADNERSLAQTFPVVAGFRPTKVTDPDPVPVQRTLLRQLDANGNGSSDLMFFNHAQARVSTWYMSGATRTGVSSFGLLAGWSLVDAADFDGNGSDDLLFASSNRTLRIFLSQGTGYTMASVTNAYASSQQPIAAADINGNGRADILLRDTSTGRVTIWYMSGATRINYNTYAIDPGYAFVGHGDFNGDRKQDLLWTNASRQLLQSISLGSSFHEQLLPLTYQASYFAAGVQDVNGDHRDDIVLTSNDHARLVTWFMDGAVRQAYSSLATNPAYRLVAKGNLDGDRLGDLLMVNASTRQILWLRSNGSNFVAATLPLVPQAGSDLMDVQLQ